MTKLNCVIMGENCKKFLPMCIKSVRGTFVDSVMTVKGADNIIYCDGGSIDGTMDIAASYTLRGLYDDAITKDDVETFFIIQNKYNQEDKGMNGKQRNFYLDYLKKHHMGEWALCIDADEVVDDITKIREFIDNPPKDMKDIISVKMRHFIDNLGQEDATEKEHYVPHRLFKIKEEFIYSETEHSVLGIKGLTWDEISKKIGYYKGTTIWHLAYCPGIFDIRKRYLNHIAKSEMHTREYLDDWYSAHLFGLYPKKRINTLEIPDVIFDEFLIDKDMIYYSTHNVLEAKHFVMAKQWIDHFKPKTILDLGCGVGLFGYAIDSYGVRYTGIEKSQWAIDNTKYKHLNIKQGDITEKQNYLAYDLVLVLDVLEHIEEKNIDKTLNNIKEYGTNYLFSIPYLGDPNLDLDITHVTKKTKEWWVNKLSKYFKIRDVPKHFMYGKQMLIGERK